MTKQNMEIRAYESDLEMTENGDEMHVKGYANRYSDSSKVMIRKDSITGEVRKFIERVADGVFSRAISEATDIQFLVEHKEHKILSSTADNSLRVNADEQGLYLDATIIPTSYGKDNYTLLKRGVRKFMSIGMFVRDDSWIPPTDGSDIWIRIINDIRLFEISLVRNPAYANTELEARGYSVTHDMLEGSETRSMDESLVAAVLARIDQIATGFEAMSAKFDAFMEQSALTDELDAIKEVNAKLQNELTEVAASQIASQNALTTAKAEVPIDPQVTGRDADVPPVGEEEVVDEEKEVVDGEEVVKEDKAVDEEVPKEDEEVPKSGEDKEEEVPAEDESPKAKEGEEVPKEDEEEVDEEDKKKKPNPFEKRSLSDFEMKKRMFELYQK